MQQPFITVDRARRMREDARQRDDQRRRRAEAFFQPPRVKKLGQVDVPAPNAPPAVAENW